jgi:hypothetical protein
MHILTQVEAKKESDSLSWLKEIDIHTSRRVEVSLFVLSPEIEDRDEVEVATGPSIQNEIYLFIFLFLQLSYCILKIVHLKDVTF